MASENTHIAIDFNNTFNSPIDDNKINEYKLRLICLQAAIEINVAADQFQASEIIKDAADYVKYLATGEVPAE